MSKLFANEEKRKLKTITTTTTKKAPLSLGPAREAIKEQRPQKKKETCLVLSKERREHKKQ